MGPEFNPADEHQPTKEEWEAYELKQGQLALPADQPDELATLRAEVERLKREMADISEWVIDSLKLETTHDEREHGFSAGYLLGALESNREHWRSERDAALAGYADLRGALESASNVMNYLGDILNAHDMVLEKDELATEEGFNIVAAALATQPPTAIAAFTARVKAEGAAEWIDGQIARLNQMGFKFERYYVAQFEEEAARLRLEAPQCLK